MKSLLRLLLVLPILMTAINLHAQILGCTNELAVNYNPNATIDDSTCLYSVNFVVDVNCADPDPGTIDTVFITGPFCSFCATGFPLSDPDMDGEWEGTYLFPAGPLEYKYMVNNFASQEDLIDDMQNGASCAPVTDFFSFANRLITVPATISVNETYGSCSPCPVGVLGCTDPAALNFDSTATHDDGSCQYNVTFAVDMNCSGQSFSTVSISGPFCGFCGSGFELSDPDSNGIYEGTFPFASPVEYKYIIDGFAGQENLIDDMVAGASCAPITDFFSFANRLISFGSDTAVDDTYGSCSPCASTCTAPYDLTVTNLTSTAAKLQWSGNAASYQVIGSKLGDPIVSFVTSAQQFQVNNLLPNTGYFWRVAALCDDSLVLSVATDTFFTEAFCQPATNVQTIDIGSDSAVLSWTPSSNALGYRLAAAEVPVDPNAIFFKTINAPASSYALKNLIPGTDYKWRIIAQCAYEASPLSPIVDFTTDGGNACTVPQNLFADSLTDNCATLTWDAVPGAIGYTVTGNAVGGNPIDAFSINVTDTEFHLTNLNSGVGYYWSVQTICDLAGNVSDFAENDTFTTTVAFGCAIPQNLFSDSITDNSANLNWDAVPGAIAYRVKGNAVGGDPINDFLVLIPSGATNEYQLTNLNLGVSYFWTVRAICDPTDPNLVSDFAVPDTFTTGTSVLPVDLAIIDIISPATGCQLSNAEPFIVRLKNEGSVSIPSGAGTIWIEIQGPVNSSLPFAFPINASIPSLTEINYDLGIPANVALPGNYSVTAAITVPIDPNQNNDTLVEMFTNLDSSQCLKTGKELHEAEHSLLVRGGIYPNPAADHVVFYSSETPVRLIIYDLNGRALRDISSFDVESGQISIPTANLAAGSYFLLADFGLHQQMHKLIIQR